jgi:hypothetical protein
VRRVALRVVGTSDAKAVVGEVLELPRVAELERRAAHIDAGDADGTDLAVLVLGASGIAEAFFGIDGRANLRARAVAGGDALGDALTVARDARATSGAGGRIVPTTGEHEHGDQRATAEKERSGDTTEERSHGGNLGRTTGACDRRSGDGQGFPA